MSEITIRELPPKPWSTRYVLLLIAALAQLIALIITWPLWNVREDIAHLPVFELGFGQFSFGWLLVLTLAIIPFRPRWGVWSHFGLMFVSCLFDQMRTQPQFLATWILMLALLGHSWKNYARWFLSSLWLWAGFHKVVSPDWIFLHAVSMADIIGLDALYWSSTLAVVVAGTEMIVGLLAWWKPKWGAIGCVLLHVGIAIYLSPLFKNWNFSVLPWNLATAIVGGWILWTCDARSTIGQRIAFCVFMTLPAGYFVGWLDHGYAHVLYSDMIAKGLITHKDGSVEKILGWGELAVPFPKERRTLRQRFDIDSVEGERLHILDPRWALDDQHFIKRNGKMEQIDRQKFFTAATDSVAGVELDSKRHIFSLSKAGARMLKRDKHSMIYAIEFKPEYFKPDQLKHLKYLPNIEEIQLSSTDVHDEDLRWLVDLPKLTAVGLNDTAITYQGIRILSESKTVVSIYADEAKVSKPSD